MIRVKFIQGNEACIIDNGKTYLFDLSGYCKQEDAGLLPKYTDGMQELPILSILSSNGFTDIALCNANGVDIRRYKTTLDSMTCALTVQKMRGFLRILRRDGKCGDISFNQLLFVYKLGTSFDSILRELQAEEAND